MTSAKVEKTLPQNGIFCRDGALLVQKPAGMTSFDVIRHLQRDLAKICGFTRKNQPSFGHTGTLDPFATGLLVVCVGQATKLVQYLTGCQKTYSAVMRLGAATDTADLTGTEIATGGVPDSIEPLNAAATTFVGVSYEQIPPMYSAKQINGERLYDLARAGKTVERQPSRCLIAALDINHYAAPDAEFRVTCSAGTYVRTLAEDLAARCDTVAHLTALHRDAIGAWRCADALPLEQAAAWLASAESAAPQWIPFDRLLDHFPRVTIDEATAVRLTAGQQGALATLLTDCPHNHPVALYHADRLAAVAAHEPRGWRLQRVFCQ